MPAINKKSSYPNEDREAIKYEGIIFLIIPLVILFCKRRIYLCVGSKETVGHSE